MSDETKQEELIVHDRRVKLEEEAAPAPEAAQDDGQEERLKVNDRRVTMEDAQQTAQQPTEQPAAAQEPFQNQAQEHSKGQANAGPAFDPNEDPAKVCGMPTMPEANFLTLVMSLSSTCLMHLGEVPSPDNADPCVDLAMAKHIIDTLAMLRDKTSGNLDTDEQRLLDGVLYELRMTYVKRKP